MRTGRGRVGRHPVVRRGNVLRERPGAPALVACADQALYAAKKPGAQPCRGARARRRRQLLNFGRWAGMGMGGGSNTCPSQVFHSPAPGEGQRPDRLPWGPDRLLHPAGGTQAYMLRPPALPSLEKQMLREHGPTTTDKRAPLRRAALEYHQFPKPARCHRPTKQTGQPARPGAGLLARRGCALRGNRRGPGRGLQVHLARQPGGRGHQRHRRCWAWATSARWPASR